jgi:P27 family predicted phage terminase small subunit
MPAKRVPAIAKADLRAVKEAMDPPNLSLGLSEDTPPPSWLGPAAAAEWVRVLEAVKLHPRWIQRADYQTVAAWCAAVGLLEEATRDIESRGVLIAGRSSADQARGPAGTVKNPSITVALQASAAMRSLGQQLGFNPTARGTLAIGPLEDDRVDDLFDLGGTWS